MTLLDALRHQWHRRVRSPIVGRSLIGTFLLVLAAAYFGVLFVAAGWAYPHLVAQMAPGQNPLQLLNEFLLYGAVALVPTRFFLQRSTGSDVRPYLPLPLRRAQIVRLMQVLSALSLLNLLPIVILAALWGSTVLPGTSALGAAFWAAGALLLVVTTQFLNSLLRAVWDRHAELMIGLAGALAVVVAGSNWIGADVLRQGSAWLFGGLRTGRVLPLLVLVGVAGGSAVGAHRALRRRLHDLLGDAPAARASKGRTLLGGWGRGATTSIALLDATLILRNKRPRQMLLLGFLAVAMFFMATATGDDTAAFNKVLFGFLLSGYLGLMYGQFGVAWHGNHFDALLLYAPSARTLVRAQFLTFAGLCAAPLLLIAPVAAVLDPSLLPFLFVLPIYNLGVTAPALILMGTWRREALKLNQPAFFNYQGTTSSTFLYGMLVVLVVMGLPLLLVGGFGPGRTLLVLAGLGVVGLGTAPLWTRALGQVLHGQRHAMATGFRNE